jgi:4-amino-4-deoxy-L-arabinose transferase-like glycosyltransferase
MKEQAIVGLQVGRTRTERAPIWFWFTLVAVFFAGTAIRVWDLRSDPFPIHLGGVEFDEGFWVHNARLAALGMPLRDDLVHAESAGPLASRLIRLSFEIGGVSFVTARLPSALAGLGLVLAVTWFAFTAWGWRHALVVAYAVSFADVAVTYSRLAVVESQMTFFLVIALMLLIHPWSRCSFVAGVAASLALLSKVTSLYFFPGFFLVIWLVETGRARWNSMARFFLGFFLPTLGWFICEWYPHAEQYTAMLKAAAQFFQGYAAWRAQLTTVLLNSFFGLASTALLLPLVAGTVADSRWHRDKVVQACVLFCLSFMLLFVPSTDHSARRCIPLFIRMLLIAARPLLEMRLRLSRVGRWSVGAAWALVTLAVWKGRLVTMWPTEEGRMLITLLFSSGSVLYLLISFGSFAKPWSRAVSLAFAAGLFAFPSLFCLARSTNTAYQAARDLAARIPPGAIITGPMVHTLALEGQYYPLFYSVSIPGLSAINRDYDLRSVAFQIVAPGIADWAPLGLGIDQEPQYVTSYDRFSTAGYRKKWRLDLYRLSNGSPLKQSPIGNHE